jgi:phosphomevalonate kinase
VAGLEDTIGTLGESIDTAEALEMTLRFQGKEAEADEIGKKRELLLQRNEELLALAMTDWLKDVQVLNVEMEEANRQVRNAIKEIEKGVKTAGQVVKAAKKLDRVIEKVTEFLT